MSLAPGKEGKCEMKVITPWHNRRIKHFLPTDCKTLVLEKPLELIILSWNKYFFIFSLLQVNVMKITHHANFVLFGSILCSIATLFWLSEACKGEAGWSWRDVYFYKEPAPGQMQGTPDRCEDKGDSEGGSEAQCSQPSQWGHSSLWAKGGQLALSTSECLGTFGTSTTVRVQSRQ